MRDKVRGHERVEPKKYWEEGIIGYYRKHPKGRGNKLVLAEEGNKSKSAITQLTRDLANFRKERVNIDKELKGRIRDLEEEKEELCVTAENRQKRLDALLKTRPQPAISKIILEQSISGSSQPRVETLPTKPCSYSDFRSPRNQQLLLGHKYDGIWSSSWWRHWEQGEHVQWFHGIRAEAPTAASDDTCSCTATATCDDDGRLDEHQLLPFIINLWYMYVYAYGSTVVLVWWVPSVMYTVVWLPRRLPVIPAGVGHTANLGVPTASKGACQVQAVCCHLGSFAPEVGPHSPSHVRVFLDTQLIRFFVSAGLPGLPRATSSNTYRWCTTTKYGYLSTGP